jgi:hypothetical protein
MDGWSERASSFRAEFALTAEQVADVLLSTAHEPTPEKRRNLMPLSRCRCHLPKSAFGTGPTHAFYPSLQYWKAKLWEDHLRTRPDVRRRWSQFGKMDAKEQARFRAEASVDWFGEGGSEAVIRGGIMAEALRRVSWLLLVHFDQCPEAADEAARRGRRTQDEESVSKGTSPFVPTKGW